MNQIRLYDLFRKELNLPDNKAADFVLAFEELTGGQSFATKNDIHHRERKIEKDIFSLEHKIGNDIHSLELKMEHSINSVELKIEQSKVDNHKAMFWTGIVQLLAILGGMMALLKFMR